MRKYFLAACMFAIITACMLFAMSTHAQTTPSPDVPKHVYYVSPSIGWAPAQDLTYSAEGGIWGTTSPTSFCMTFDIGKNVSKEGTGEYSKWLGLKAYYDLKDMDKLSYFTYIALKINLQGTNETLIEYGFNPCYTLNKHFIACVTVGNQVLSTSQLNMFANIGILYMFKK